MMLAKSFLFVLLLAAILAPIVEAQGPRFFRRVGTFFPCSQIEPKCNTNVTAVAEIVTASRDGNTLIYTDSEGKTVGFVNITDPSKPIAAGFLPVSGEPTSVTIVRDFAVAVIDTSPNKINTTGEMIVINIASKSVVATFQLGGQPDCINVSPDGNSLAIAIENERNETLGSGNPPQLPEGFLVLVDSSDANPAAWSLRKVTLTGLTGMTFPTDPEPEYVSINSNNVGVVSLQENNAFAIFDVNTSSILRSFTAGNVTLEKVDANENIRFVSQNQTITVTRQPDSVAWMGTRYFASADEGDLSGSGGRTFTVFDSTDGSVAYSPGNELEWWAVRTGHYSEVCIEAFH